MLFSLVGFILPAPGFNFTFTSSNQMFFVVTLDILYANKLEQVRGSIRAQGFNRMFNKLYLNMDTNDNALVYLCCYQL